MVGSYYSNCNQLKIAVFCWNCTVAVKKAHTALFLVKRSFVNLTPAVFLPLYCTFVRPHLEYAIQATLSYWKKDTYLTERFQRFATRLGKGLHHLPNIQRLPRLNVCSLETRRQRADLIFAYEIFHDRYDLPQDIFFTLPSCSHFCGHDLELRHRVFHLARRKGAFSVRIVEPWNKLPPFVINSPSVVVFKNRLDACWETIFGLSEP